MARMAPMGVEQPYLQSKLHQLEQYVQEVQSLRGELTSAGTASYIVEAAAERMLERAMQCAIDIATHIVAQEALGNPTQYKDVFMFLGRAGILEPDLTDRLEKMAGFRNVLIHEYTQINPKRVYEAVHKDIDDLATFAKAVGNKYL